MSRAPTLSATTRAALTTKVCLALGLSAGCLQSGYVLSDRGGTSAGGQGTGGSGGISQVGGEAGVGGSDAVAGSSGCEATFEAGLDLAVCAARYWGSSDNDTLSAVDITTEGDVIVGGQSDVLNWGVPTLETAGGTAGVVARLNPGTGNIEAVARVGGSVTDLAARADSVLVATDRGVQALSLTLDAVLYESLLGGVTRVAAAGDFVAALTTDARAFLLDETLSPIRELSFAGRSPEDVAVDATGIVSVTGSRAPADGAECLGSLPFIDTYDASGALVWSAYGFADAPGWCASSQGKRLAIKDGQLYYAGEQEGGNSVHQRDPRDLSLQAPLVSYDTFSTSAGKAIDVYSFVARFELATGTLQSGQVIVPRDADGVGGTLFSSALAVDEAGRIFLGGRVSCCLENRGERSVAGQSVGAFAGEEASLLILSADLRQRLAWTTFTNSGPANANIASIAVHGGLGVLVASASETGSLIVHPQDASDVRGGDDGYFVSFPAP